MQVGMYVCIKMFASLIRLCSVLKLSIEIRNNMLDNMHTQVCIGTDSWDFPANSSTHFKIFSNQ